MMRVLVKRSLRRAVALALLSLSLSLSLPSCRQQEEMSPPTEPLQGLLRIGIIPEHNLFAQKKRYQPIADYLSRKLRTTIELKMLSRYGNIVDNFVSSRLDAAFFGSFTGALAYKKLHIEPLARPEYPDGTSTYRGLLFVRRDSDIRAIEHMKGRRFVFVDKATTAGWLLPLHYFKTHGVEDFRSWLSESYFAGSHEGAIYDVLERRADIGAAKDAVFNRLAIDDPRITQELLVLARSPSVPENALCVRPGLDESLKNALRSALLEMDEDRDGREVLAAFGAARFIPTVESDYSVVFEFADAIGLDLESYDYVND
jgi:phosphonate transport system substrate-binding protein